MKLIVKDIQGQDQGELEVKFPLIENMRGTQAVHDVEVRHARHRERREHEDPHPATEIATVHCDPELEQREPPCRDTAARPPGARSAPLPPM